MENLAEIFGSIAATLAVMINIPQIIKIIKTKRSRDLSLFMIIIIFFCNIFWFLNGYLSHSISRELSGLFIMILSLFMIYLKFKYDKNG